jgi:hypothetical protein
LARLHVYASLVCSRTEVQGQSYNNGVNAPRGLHAVKTNDYRAKDRRPRHDAAHDFHSPDHIGRCLVPAAAVGGLGLFGMSMSNDGLMPAEQLGDIRTRLLSNRLDSRNKK